ncbi:MAG: sulfotransferase domain-containing protein [Actinomycetota bacterium]
MTNLANFALRARFPRPVKEFVRAGVERYGTATSRSRAMPDYVIVGGQRCGTTSLYQYLIEHPAVGAATTKEVHFFDINYERGPDWYRGHFPTNAYLRAVAHRTGMRATTGEASPYYLYHPRAPYRLADMLPDAKLVVMLRDPVSRLISHFHHEVSLGHEDQSLERAIELEPERLAGEGDRMLREPTYHSYAHQHHSYFARGVYAEQLERWFAVFPREHVLIVESRRFFKEPSGELDRVLGFLGLPPQGRTTFEAHNARDYVPVSNGLKASLYERYAPHNERLCSLLGEDLDWGMKA